MSNYWAEVVKTMASYEPEFDTTGMSQIEIQRERQRLIRQHNQQVLAAAEKSKPPIKVKNPRADLDGFTDAE